MTTQNKICVWDCTLPENKHTIESIKEWCKEWCKKWCFQLELSEKTEYLHYQLRCSLKVGCRNMTKHLKPCNWTPTSTDNRDNLFYVIKNDTRVDGPWSDKTEPVYIPKQIQFVEGRLRPWQSTALEMSKVWDTRKINIIFDSKGNIGKTTWSLYMEVHKLGTIIPYVNNYKDVMRSVCDMGASPCYIIDIPRSIKKKNMRDLYAGIETIKGGFAYDDRYSMKKIFFDCPCIWVFTNKLPKASYLSPDRWRYFTITKDQELVYYTPKPEDYAGSKSSHIPAGGPPCGGSKALRCNTVAPVDQPVGLVYNNNLSTRTNRTTSEIPPVSQSLYIEELEMLRLHSELPPQEYEEF